VVIIIFKMDDIDKNIINLLAVNPDLTHSQIAKEVNRSQPTVGSRLKRLEKSGIFQRMFGINIKNTSLCLAKIEVQSSKSNKLKERLHKKTGILCIFSLTGEYNINILMVGKSVKILEKTINNYLKNENVKKFKIEFILDICNDFVLPINI